jgi:hypothetical protein
MAAEELLTKLPAELLIERPAAGVEPAYDPAYGPFRPVQNLDRPALAGNADGAYRGRPARA